MNRITLAVRNYWNDGRGLILLRYAILSYSIAAVEWILATPENVFQFFPTLPHRDLDQVYLLDIFVFPAVWLGFVIKGIRKSGWPGIILLLPIKWGMWLSCGRR